jgi:hypothetical protein
MLTGWSKRVVVLAAPPAALFADAALRRSWRWWRVRCPGRPPRSTDTRVPARVIVASWAAAVSGENRVRAVRDTKVTLPAACSSATFGRTAAYASSCSSDCT